MHELNTHASTGLSLVKQAFSALANFDRQPSFLVNERRGPKKAEGAADSNSPGFAL
jgi:hypothetical protein